MRAAAQMLGYSQIEVIGKNVHQLMHHTRPDGSPYPYEECPTSGVLRTGEGCRIDDEVLWRRDKTSFPVEYSSYPILDNGVIQGAVVTFNDITKRKLLEQQLIQTQKIESLGTLAGGIAHDFNNILGIIMGHAAILNFAQTDSSKLHESIGAINRASQRGAGLVRQLLTFARKTDVVLESVRVNDVINEVAKLLSETFPKTITMALHLEKNLPSIHADANQLHQVLLNLCVNARDAMPSGGTLSIATHLVVGDVVRKFFSKAAAAEYVTIDVIDTGIGMDEATRSRIFEPFFTTKELGRGTGLGLAVVFGIVESHRGFIDVDSKLGRGTTFHLYFPVQPQMLDSFEDKKDAMKEIRGGTETILFVEDEEMLRELVKAILISKGYNVLTANDGMEMIEVYSRHQNDIALVVTDMGLPKINGYEAMKKLKEMNKNVKVVLASGYLDPDLKSEILKAGAKDFIQKPYLPDEILKKVRDILDHNESRS